MCIWLDVYDDRLHGGPVVVGSIPRVNRGLSVWSLQILLMHIHSPNHADQAVSVSVS